MSSHPLPESQPKPIAEGSRVPSARFKVLRAGRMEEITSEELFGGRNVVVFSLPGAFTPTCSAQHLPRYEELVPRFRELGIDDVACVSVNDAFVMEAWRDAEGVERVLTLADGGADFTRAMGMAVTKHDLGFGIRSWRYSMLVRNGVIEKLFVEPQIPGDPFEVSDADTMLAYLKPGLPAQPQVAVFTRSGCPHCARAKQLLESRGLHYDEIPLGGSLTTRSLRAVAGAASVPQIFIDGRLVGGADALEAEIDTVCPLQAGA